MYGFYYFISCTFFSCRKLLPKQSSLESSLDHKFFHSELRFFDQEFEIAAEVESEDKIKTIPNHNQGYQSKHAG
ncbi:hypothetical protein VNO77_24425 [Canavalia gladiata]|uniref:Uncharacterized protein n=1 Tax=Canavalia gladiata TaxID=3824 RepID=A0AAN9L692_CANGL